MCFFYFLVVKKYVSSRIGTCVHVLGMAMQGRSNVNMYYDIIHYIHMCNYDAYMWLCGCALENTSWYLWLGGETLDRRTFGPLARSANIPPSYKSGMTKLTPNPFFGSIAEP